MITEKIEESWSDFDRIGDNIPNYSVEYFSKIENEIIALCEEYRLDSKFNVSAIFGGIPHPKDNGPLKNPDVKSITYADCMGGIRLSSRNMELNCRHYDNIVSREVEGTTIFDKVIIGLKDKYSLGQYKSDHKNIIFLPGSNLSDALDYEKIDEIIIDYNAAVKPHPIYVEESLDDLKRDLEDTDWIDHEVSGMECLQNCEIMWTPWSSEMGLIAAMMDIQFGTITKWEKAHRCTYSEIYRKFKYKNKVYNKEVMRKLLESKDSGFIFPWQEDYKERLRSFFESITSYKEGYVTNLT